MFKFVRSVPTTREENNVKMNVQLITLLMRIARNVCLVLWSVEDVMVQPSVTVRAVEIIKFMW